jgi:parvulin-like peptidyl-prolyl isomerase
MSEPDTTKEMDVPKDDVEASKSGLPRTGLLLFVVLLVVAGVGFASFFPSLINGQVGSVIESTRASVTTSVSDEALQTLAERVKDVEGRLDRLNTQMTDIANVQLEASKDPSLKLDKEVRDEVKKQAQEIDSLKSLLEQAKADTKDTASGVRQDMRVLLAATRLSSRVVSGRSFEQELAALKLAAGPSVSYNSAMERLAVLAPQGVATPHLLSKLWFTSYRQAKSALMEAQSQTWKDRILAALEGLISVRRLSQENDDAQKIMAAESAMESGNLDVALKVVGELPQPVQDHLQKWKEAASKYVQAQSALDEIGAALAEASPAGMISSPPVEEEKGQASE